MNTPYYENIEFNLTNGQSDYDLTNQSAFLVKFGPDSPTRQFPNWAEIRTNEEISVKLNGTSEDSITITSVDIPYIIKDMEIRNMYLSNSSGETARVKIRFQLHE